MKNKPKLIAEKSLLYDEWIEFKLAKMMEEDPEAKGPDLMDGQTEKSILVDQQVESSENATQQVQQVEISSEIPTLSLGVTCQEESHVTVTRPTESSVTLAQSNPSAKQAEVTSEKSNAPVTITRHDGSNQTTVKSDDSTYITLPESNVTTDQSNELTEVTLEDDITKPDVNLIKEIEDLFDGDDRPVSGQGAVMTVSSKISELAKATEEPVIEVTRAMTVPELEARVEALEKERGQLTAEVLAKVIKLIVLWEIKCRVLSI